MTAYRMGAALFAVSLVATACAQMAPSGLMAMRDFDPLTADPVRLRAAVAAPAAIAPKPEGVRLDVVHARIGGADKISLSLALEAIPATADGLGRTPRARAGSALHLFRLPPKEIERLRAFRETVATRNGREPGAWAGNLTITAAGCLLSDRLPDGPLLLDTWIKTEQTPDYTPLIQGYDFRPDLAGKPAAEALGTCG